MITFLAETLQCTLPHLRIWIAENFPGQVERGPRKQRQAKTERKAERPAEAAVINSQTESGEADTKTAGNQVGQRPETPAVRETSTTNVAAQRHPLKLRPLKFSLKLDVDGCRSYLQGRGLTDETIAKYGCGLASKGIMAGYVVMPIFRYPKQSPDERPVGYVGRLPRDEGFSEETPKYKLPAGFPKRQIVFGLDEALAEGNAADLILVENPISAMLLTQWGFPAVSVLGSHLAAEQSQILLSLKTPIAVMFDGDDAGRAGAIQAMSELGSEGRKVDMPDGKSPDELSPEELAGLLGRDVCHHAAHAFNDTGRLQGSWTVEQTDSRYRIVCCLCGKFFGYLDCPPS